MKKRIVITGIGVVSSIGIGKDEFWSNLVSGKCGISEVTSIDVSDYEFKRAGEVKNFQPEKFIPKNKLKGIARASQFAIAGAKLAIKDANLESSFFAKEKTAIIIGTTMSEGGMVEEADKHWTKVGEEDVWATTISKYPSNVISNNVNSILNFKGTSCVIPTACAAGNYSIGFGYDLIRSGRLNYALVGGADPFSRIGFTGFSRLYAMSPDFCRPFDKNRQGMMLGEGSGILVLEEFEAAKKRGAKIYAEILGYGLSCDAYNMTIPSQEGIAKVMRKALKNSQVRLEDVGYICTHGTGTPMNDKTECAAIKDVFGKLTNDMYISSIKSMLGHTMGAASAIEAISCCLALEKGVMPPTINYETPDPECDINCVPNESIKKELKVVLNNSFAFGGNNACLIVGRV